MIKFNISKPKKYIDRGTGQEKTFWQNIGTLTEFPKQDGGVSRILEIPAIGLEAFVFPIVPKENKDNNNGYPPLAPTTTNQPVQQNDEINPEEIPW